MRAVKSEDTGPEMTVRRIVHRLGFRYRLHRRDLPGCPDLVFVSRRKVIFVHGCFWHGHDCARGARVPKTNVEYWTAKIGRNRSRDATAVKQLRRDGWGVLVLWECKLNQRDLLKRVESFLRNDSPPMGNAR
jgi:DNA mismatch endonuclease (patch repair protein)